MNQKNTSNLKKLGVVILVLVGLNLVSEFVFRRFDLTRDHRYTLSKTSFAILEEVNRPLTVDVYLDGDFPGEFKKLQTETRQLLEEFHAYNPEVTFRFINPLDDSEEAAQEKQDIIYDIFRLDNPVRSAAETSEIKKSIKAVPDLDKALVESFAGSGMTPARVSVNDKGKQSQEVVFPWAIAKCEGRSVRIPLLKNLMGATVAEKVVGSVQHLEYAFANAFNTVSRAKEKKVAVLKGNGELPDLLMADFIRSVRDNYGIGTFTLDSVGKQPVESLKYLKRYDLVVIAKPTETFTDAEKQVLDQFVMNGGRTLWLVDEAHIEIDSLMSTGATLAYPRNLNLTDLLFKYGVRINPNLVKDLQNAPIALASGQEGSGTQFMQYPWFYAPLVYPQSQHPIVKHLDAVRFDFANGMDTLRNGIKKTVLLRSSANSKAVGTPVEVRLDMVEERPDPAQFKGKGDIPMAVLLEGKFTSAWQNRVLPFAQPDYQAEGKANRMIVISDGDLIRNQLDKNYQPMELGFDKWTNNLYANKEFLLNCVNYLLDDKGLLDIRSKEVSLPILDPQKVYDNYSRSQFITVGAPLVVLLAFGLLFNYLRKKRYSR